jgi:aspartyl-tRNA(Asn)/glutamyl-tRNA(Gln) amidotransferase subunit A
MAWTAEDCAMVLQVIAGYDPNDPASARQAVPDFLAGLNAGARGLRVGLPRHLWEDEAPVAREAQAAFDQALKVLEELGASMDTVRMRKRQQYNDVRSVISRSELLSIYDRDLRERPGDFGADFLARNLAACMYTAGDVVRAQRERRRMVAEIGPLFEHSDVLLTPAPSPAPRLDSLLGGGFADKWENPNLYVPFSLLGLPAMVVCTGYTGDGLPLSMQIVGRPFDEATVLRVGHAYERATRWRERRPLLTPGAPKPVLREPPASPVAAPMNADTRRALDNALARAGYPLNDVQRGMIDRVAPQVLAAAQRLPRDHGSADEPAAVFQFRGE